MSGITPPRGVDTSRTSDNAPRGDSPRDTPTRTANREDSDRLAKLLREDKPDRDGNNERGSRDEEEKTPSSDTLPSPADLILAGLGGFQPPAPVEAAPATEPSTPIRGVELSELADKVVERVLSGTRADGEAELRITLNSETFGATEVSLAKHQGALELRIDTMSDDMRLLMARNGEGFTNDLAKRLDMPVTVEVRAASRSDEMFGQGGGDNRRSRGLEQILRYVAESGS